ncbi:MAG: gluconeogenesis factor YvcK family protein [Patescibacteria group bacterium]|jgi:uncharacterized cofD-like protein
MNKKRIVVIGGGTGTSVVLSGLKQTGKCELSAIVVVSDSGGSTGRLRDEFGFLPVGDLRQCLAALATGEHQEEVREVLLYRFSKGNGLAGHNLGNLILTALEDLKLTPGKAIETAGQIFRIDGNVYPITEENVNLVIEYGNGLIKIGESNLDDPKLGGQKIASIKLSPRASIYNKAAQAIRQADLVILGPGDLYGSLLPNTLVRGFKTTLRQSRAQFVYIVNLMTHFSQTHGMTASSHVDEVVRYTGRKPDIIIINSSPISQSVLKRYASQKEYPVKDDLLAKNGYCIVRSDCLSQIMAKPVEGDTIPRNLLRHDGQKLAKILLHCLPR